MKYYIIAGEASGDLHASNLMKELSLLDKKAVFRFWGGDLMQGAGGELVKHYRELAFMGFTEVLLNIKTILDNIKFCKKDILAFRPDAVILVDYPGFNLRIAGFVKKLGIKVFYYISPQIWAWNASRVHEIKKVVDKMLVILPFEKDFYKKYDYDVDFVGHPLLDVVAKRREKQIEEQQKFRTENQLNYKKIIAVVPGSRKQEIVRMLPLMLNMQQFFPDYLFVVAAVPSLPQDFYHALISQHTKVNVQDVKMVYGKTYNLLENAVAALVTSGTATLETALFGVPEVVCYKGGTLSYYIAKMLVKVKYISLVNLIMNREIVKELIQNDFNEQSLKAELSKLLYNEVNYKKIKQEYNYLKEKLGNAGASQKAASIIYSNIT